MNRPTLGKFKHSCWHHNHWLQCFSDYTFTHNVKLCYRLQFNINTLTDDRPRCPAGPESFMSTLWWWVGTNSCWFCHWILFADWLLEKLVGESGAVGKFPDMVLVNCCNETQYWAEEVLPHRCVIYYSTPPSWGDPADCHDFVTFSFSKQVCRF